MFDPPRSIQFADRIFLKERVHWPPLLDEDSAASKLKSLDSCYLHFDGREPNKSHLMVRLAVLARHRNGA